MRSLRKTILFIVGILTLLAVYIFGISLPAGKRTKLHVGDAVFEVEIADDPARRGQGLSGRERLADKEGMLFVFESPAKDGFWMREMKFALDFIWIADGKVIGLTQNVEPEPEKGIMDIPVYYPPEPVTQVLEVNSGTVERLGLKVGDKVSLEK